MSIFTGAFWKAAAERAVKTGAQASVLAIGALHLTSLDDVVTTGQALGYSFLGGAILSIVTSLASDQFGSNGPSLTNEVVTGA
jgi:hypothetical protein